MSPKILRQSMNQQNKSYHESSEVLREDHENLSSSDEKMQFQKNDIQESLNSEYINELINK